MSHMGKRILRNEDTEITKQRGHHGQRQRGMELPDMDWGLELEFTLTPRRYVPVNKRFEVERVVHQIQTLQVCEPPCGGTPATQRNQCLTYFK